MKLKSVIPFAIVIGTIAVAFVMVASKKAPEKKVVEKKPPLVETMQVMSEDLSFIVNSQGSVVPKLETALIAQVSGKVISVSDTFIEGGFFMEGDVLLRLDPSDYETDLKSAQSNLASAQAALDEELARAKVAEEEYRSVRAGNIPELGLRKPQLKRELARVQSAEANVERAKRNLERTFIRAPFNGLVKSKNIDVGQFVGAGVNLGTVYGTDVAEVRLPLTDNDLAFLDLPTANSPEKRLDVKLSAKVAGEYRNWSAQIVRSEGLVDSKSRVIYGVAEVLDPYNRQGDSDKADLHFGRFVSAEITGQSVKNLIVLPRYTLNGGNHVAVLDKDNKISIRDISVKRSDSTNVYIDGGLNHGELIITTALANPINGMLVRTEDDTEEAPESSKEAEVAQRGEN